MQGRSGIPDADDGSMASDQAPTSRSCPILTLGIVTENPHTGGHPALQGREPCVMMAWVWGALQPVATVLP